MTAAVVFGCAGYTLSEAEHAFFREVQPWGLMLFRRNVDSPAQVRALTDAFRDCVGWDAPVLVDQEGGRVQRLGPPHWPKYPPASAYLKASNDPLTARELARLSARLMAHDLKAMGVNIDCVPVLDVPVPGAHDIIGDRAYATDPATVTQLGRAAAEGLLAGGVLPVIKHMPGHGRAIADTHVALPTVETDFETLDAWDFAPFKALSDMPIAMSAHIVFEAIDPKNPATTSRKAIRLMREHLGFKGLILSDDLMMNALKGSLSERAERSLKAGCDIVVHWTGKMDEMQQVMAGVRTLTGRASRRAEAALGRIVHTPEPLDLREARERFDAMLSGRLDAARGPDVGEAQA